MICYGDEAHITNIAVDPQRHRHGIGSPAAVEQMAQSIEMGARAVSLEVRVTNWGAQRLYGWFGFHPVGIRRDYYQELNEDALIMWTDDVPHARVPRRLASIAREIPGAAAERRDVITLGIETSCDETAVAVVEDGFTCGRT